MSISRISVLALALLLQAGVLAAADPPPAPYC
jgi:hypothetical protein